MIGIVEESKRATNSKFLELAATILYEGFRGAPCSQYVGGPVLRTVQSDTVCCLRPANNARWAADPQQHCAVPGALMTSQSQETVFTPYRLGNLELPNRIGVHLAVSPVSTAKT